MPVTVKVKPTPQMLVGFATREEAADAQQLCLTAPISIVKKFMAGLKERFEKGEIIAIQFEKPEPTTRGETIWIVEPLA
jgi:hypothetical protein